jgi:hypothetical protein
VSGVSADGVLQRIEIAAARIEQLGHEQDAGLATQVARLKAGPVRLAQVALVEPADQIGPVVAERVQTPQHARRAHVDALWHLKVVVVVVGVLRPQPAVINGADRVGHHPVDAGLHPGLVPAAVGELLVVVR